MSEVETRLGVLRAEIRRHDRLYYEDAAPLISDTEYDQLFRELENLETAHPELADPDSPTKRVGGKPLEAFSKVAHPIPMLSIDDLFSEGEIGEFYRRLEKNLGPGVEVGVEPKIDGVACSLVYEKGRLKHAATRGDGRTGDDITENVKTIRRVPTDLDARRAPEFLEVRGEIFFPAEAFVRLNAAQDAAGLPTFANPRNAAAGTVKMLDSRVVAMRPLDFRAHGLGLCEPAPETEDEFHQLLDDLGIPRNQPKWIARSLGEVMAAIHELDDLRHNLSFGTDGAVIKVTNHAARAELGSTSRAPRWAAAFKYPPEQVETKLHAITVQVGRTGVLTPVAELDPVLVSGSTVSRATLHNQEEIERKDIRPGDTVVIEKAGEIIPQVVRVILEKRPPESQPYNLFQAVNGHCPSCGGPIEKKEGFVAWRCRNFACPAQAVTGITHFASRKALDLDGLGESVAVKLVESGLVETPLELFKLDEADLADLMLDPARGGTGEIISKERRFGEKRAAKLIHSLQRARNEMPLNRWIFAMGIAHIGEASAREVSRLHEYFHEIPGSKILEKIDRIAALETAQREISPRNSAKPPTDEAEKTARQARYDEIKAEIAEFRTGLEELQISPDLGPVACAAIRDYFSSPAGREVTRRLSELGIDPKSDNFAPSAPATATGGLAGKVFVITGTLSKPRPDFKKMIESHGGKVVGSVSGKTDYLLAGEKAGSKREQAEKHDVAILDEEGLAKLLDEGT